MLTQEECPLNDYSVMPFGKHKNVALANVPASYLLWWKDYKGQEKLFGFDKQLMDYINDNMDSLSKEK